MAAKNEPFRQAFKAMGSPCEVQIYLEAGNQTVALARAVVDEVERLEQKYSRYRDDSFLSDINRAAAAGGRIKVDDETALLLDYAGTCYEQSDGLFDITSGILRQAWDFRAGRLADPEALQRLLPRIGWSKAGWDGTSLSFAMPGMEIDFGGVVKEYAVDRCATLLEEAGAKGGFINLGGDLRVVGPRRDGTPWKIGIRHHRIVHGIAGTVEMSRGAMATSGDYERCIVIDGRHFGHVLNPRTGWPVDGLAAVSVIADLCMVAGSASTIAMLKERDGAEWLLNLGLPFRWTDVDGNSGGTF